MSTILIILVGVVYLWIALDFFLKHNYPMSLTFFAYSLANLGLYLETK